MSKVTVFKSLYNSKEPLYSDVATILDKIKTGGDLKDDIVSLRKLEGKEYKKTKEKLPIICFCGKFKARNKEDLIVSSGIAPLDFDSGTEDELNAIRNELRNESYTLSLFDSPNGKGRFKALIKIPSVRSDEEYKEYYASLQEKYPTLDKSCKDISRGHFMSYDPDIYINLNAETWTEKIEKNVEKKLDAKEYKATATDYGLINIMIDKLRKAPDGTKHYMLLSMSRLAGGYISGGKVQESEALRLLEQTCDEIGVDNFSQAQKTIRDGIEYGKKAPIYEIKKLETIQPDIGITFFQMADVLDKVKDIYEKGYERGESLGWDISDEYYTIKKRATTYIYASPASGKTNFTMQVLVNLSVSCGWKHAILSTETGDAPEVYAELISIHAGKSFSGDYKMNAETMAESADFIAQHFIVIDPEGKNMTIQDFLDQVDYAENHFNVHIDTVTIDPINELSADFSKFGGREDKYLERVLTDFRQHCVTKDRHGFIVNHVRDMQPIRKDDTIFYPMPHTKDNAGGQLWHRKGFGMIAIWRPVDVRNNPLNDERGIPYEDNEMIIAIQKSKPKNVGKVGEFRLYYDWKANRYYERNDIGQEFFAWGEPRNESARPPQIKPDTQQASSDSEQETIQVDNKELKVKWTEGLMDKDNSEPPF